MDDIKKVFEKIEKAEAILKDLDRMREDRVAEKGAHDRLSKEHQRTVDSARQTITAIRDKLSKELAVRTLELDKCQEDLAQLQAKLKNDEISEQEYKSRSKHLLDKIEALEKKVIDIQHMISARFAADVAPLLLAERASASRPPDEKPEPEAAPEAEKPAEAVTASAAGSKEEPAEPQEAAAPAEVAPAKEEAAAPAGAPAVQEEPVSPPAAEQPPAEKEAEAPAEAALDKEKEKAVAAAETSADSQEAGKTGKGEEQAEAAVAAAAAAPGKKHEVAVKSHHRSLHLHRLQDRLQPIQKKSILQTLKNNRPVALALGAFILALVLWGIIALVLPHPGSNIGNVAPDFAMELGDGTTTSLSAFKGRNVVLVFWDRDFWDNQFFYVNGAIRKLYTPDKLQQLYDEYPHNELIVVAITSGTNHSEIDKLIQDYEIKFPVIVDSLGKLRTSYNVSYEPTFVFLDRNGIIRARVEGPVWNLSDFEQIVHGVTTGSSFKTPKPPISDVLIQSITEKSAIINWSTDAATTTQIDVDGKVIQTVITPTPQTIHSVTLRDLSPNTSYRFRIVYNINNINVSEHSFDALADTIVSKRYQIATSGKDTSYPEISSISTGFITDSSMTVTWKTDEPTTGDVEYGVDRNYSESSTQGPNLTIWHTVKLEVLKPNTEYYLRIRSKDSAGKETIQEIEPIKTQNSVEIGPTLGKRAPDFTLYSLVGNKYTLSQLSGRPVLLNFWLEGCPACEGEMPILQAAFNKYGSKLVVLAINVRGDPDKVNYFVNKEKITFPILMDTQGDVDGVYRAPYFPTSYFIDSNGIITNIVEHRFQTVGEIDDIVSKMK